MFEHGINTEQYLQLFDQNMAVAVFDSEGILSQANSNYLAVVKMIYPAISIGQSYHKFIPSYFLEKNQASLEQCFLHKKPFVGIFQHFTVNGELHYFEIKMLPSINHTENKVEYIQILSDITKSIDLQKEKHLDRLKLAVDSIDTAMLITNEEADIIYANEGFNRLFGWTNAEVFGKNSVELLRPHEDFFDFRNYKLAKPIGDEKSVELKKICISKFKQFHWVKIIINFIFNDEGELAYKIVTFTDVTRSKLYESLQYKALEAMIQEKPLSNVLEIICLEVERIVPDIAATILEVDQQGILHPLAAPSLPASYSLGLDGIMIGPCVGSCGTAAWRKQPIFVKDIAKDPLWDIPQKQEILSLGYIGCWSTPIFNREMTVIGSFAFYFKQIPDDSVRAFYQYFVNASTHLCALAIEREHTRQHISQLAFYDALTQLPNRALLRAKIDQVLAKAIQNTEKFAVLFIDLDRFKKINDSLGHKAGDELLSKVAVKIRSELKPREVTGRLSGDEFVIALPNCTVDQVTSRVEHLQAILSEPMLIAGTSISISASVGIAMFPVDGRDIDTLLNRADMAMYQAKKINQGSFCFFSAEMNQQAQEKLLLENALRQAIRDNQLELYYQPQVRLDSENLYGIEALARWNHPQMGFIAPSIFISLAEECGLIIALGYWALKEACSQLAKWHSQGIEIPTVSVNLSAINFHDLSLPNIIAQTLHTFNLKPQMLTLELTESILLDTNPNTMATITTIHDLGVRLSMDDFGTGYASLSCLRRLSVNELKLDRSFVADLDTDETARALSGAILDIGRNLKLDVVAEGVETEEQIQFLRKQGYSLVQGYLFAKPMSSHDLETWWYKKTREISPISL